MFGYLGFNKGVAKTAISIAGTIVSSILTMFLSGPIAEAIYKGGFKQRIIEKVTDASKLFAQSGEGSLIDKILATMPHFVNNSLGNFGLSKNKLADFAQQGPEQVEKALAPIIISFISVFVSIGLFLLISIIIKLICRVIAANVDDSYIGTANRFLGAVVGIIEAFVVVIVAAFIIRLTVPHLEKVPEIITDETISQSTVFKGIYDSPILTDFIGKNTKSPNTRSVEQ